MNSTEVRDALVNELASSCISNEGEGTSISTPFINPDGDHVVVTIEEIEDGRWRLSGDCGYYPMDYQLYGKICRSSAGRWALKYDNGSIYIITTEDNMGRNIWHICVAIMESTNAIHVILHYDDIIGGVE